MTGTEYLQKYKRLQSAIRHTTERVQELRYQSVSMAHPMKEAMVHSSSVSDKTGDLVVRIVETEEHLNELIKQKTERQIFIFGLVMQLSDMDHQTIMIARYVQLKTWPEISAETGFSLGWLYKLHGKAMISFNKLFENTAEAGETA